MTPNPVCHRQRRLKPLPLCLSDNEKNMPVLAVITSEENCNANVSDEGNDDDRCIDD